MSETINSRNGRLLLEDGTFINEAGWMELETSFFHQKKTVHKEPQIVLNSDLPLSNRRDDQNTSNGATITQLDASYRLRASTTSGSNAKLRTRQRGNYWSGAELEAGMGVRVPVQPTGDAFVRWGYFNDDDGIFFEWNSNGLHVVTRKNATDTKVEQAEWNRDQLDGSGGRSNPSGGTLDVTEGNVYQIPFVYYGFGGIKWQVGINDEFGRNRILDVHTIKMDNVISLDEPNLPITLEVDSGTTGTQLDAFIRGRQISALGKNDRIARTVGAFRRVTSVGTSFVPLISFRHRTDFGQIPVRFGAVEIFSADDLIWEIQRNATLDSENFSLNSGAYGNFDSDEMATEWDVSAGTTFTSGESIFIGMTAGSNKSNVSKQTLPFRPVSELDTYTLAAKCITASNSTILSVFKAEEDW